MRSSPWSGNGAELSVRGRVQLNKKVDVDKCQHTVCSDKGESWFGLLS